MAATKRPPKAVINKLVELWARKRDAEKSGAPVAVQQAAYNRWLKLHSELEAKYPDMGVGTDAYFDQLERFARDWLQKKAMRGPGASF